MVVLLLIIVVCDVFPYVCQKQYCPWHLFLGTHILQQHVKTCSPNWFCCLCSKWHSPVFVRNLHFSLQHVAGFISWNEIEVLEARITG